MATQVDWMIVADNRSVDGTHDILCRLADELPLVVQFDPEVGYMQSEKMTRLAHVAGKLFDADWIVPFDADEIWYSSWGRLGDFLEAQPDDVDIVEANLFDHVATAFDDPNEPDPVKRIRWRRDHCAELPKVACRYSPNLVIGMGNHEAWYTDHAPRTGVQRLAVRHFPYRSAAQVIRKIRNGAEAYAATDLDPKYGAHWRQWGQFLERDGEEAIEALFRKWHWRDSPDIKISIDGEISMPLRLDPATDAASIW
jgi:hypothetical protein